MCDFILKCLESMRHYIPFNEIIFNVAVTPHIIYNEMHSSDCSKNLISYFTKSISCCLVRLARIVTCWERHGTYVLKHVKINKGVNEFKIADGKQKSDKN